MENELEFELEDQLAVLRRRVGLYDEQIQQHVRALHGSGEPIDFKYNALESCEDLHEDVQALLIKSQTCRAKAALYNHDIQELQRVSASLTTISTLGRLLEDCERFVRSSNIPKVCQLLQSIRDHLPAESLQGGAMKSLERDARQLRATFTARLKTFIFECITVKYGQAKVLKRLQGVVDGELIEEAVQLGDIWNALLKMGAAERIVSDVTKRVWVYLCAPLWAIKKVVPAETVSTANESSFTFETLIGEQPSMLDAHTVDHTTRTRRVDTPENLTHAALKPSDLLKTGCKMSFPSLLEHLMSVLNFLHTDILLGYPDLVLTARETLESSQIQLITCLEHTLIHAIPQSEKQVPQFVASIGQCCKSFEDRLAANKFMQTSSRSAPSPGTTKGEESKGIAKGPLTSLIDDAAEISTRKLRDAFLLRARDMILLEYHNTMPAYGDVSTDDPASAYDDPNGLEVSFDDKILPFEPCHVSIVCFKLLRCVHETLQEASRSSEKMAGILFRTAREQLELFRAIIPNKNANLFASTPKMSALFYNDCVYIAHALVSIGHQYNKAGCADSDVITSLNTSAAMVDLVPMFRDLGAAYLNAQTDMYRVELSKLVQQLYLFDAMHRSGQASPIHDDPATAAAIVAYIKRLEQDWKGVLQASVYDHVVGSLLNDMTSALLNISLRVSDIAEKEAHQVHRIFKSLQECASVLHVSSSSTVAQLVPSWHRFLALTDMMEYSLNDVTEQISRGKFSGFTADEMISLLSALFEDSPRRQSVISSIQHMR